MKVECYHLDVPGQDWWAVVGASSSLNEAPAVGLQPEFEALATAARLALMGAGFVAWRISSPEQVWEVEFTEGKVRNDYH